MGQAPRGGTLPGPGGGGGTLPCQDGGGYPAGGYPAGGYPGRYPPWARSGWRGVPPPGQDGGTQLGQQKEYSLHGGRYASCVHARGLSCC